MNEKQLEAAMANGSTLDMNKEYKKSVEQIAHNLIKELSVLELNLKTLKECKDLAVLPMVIHNICVIFERESYRFLEPLKRLYADLGDDEKGKRLQENLKELVKKEDALYIQQYEALKKRDAEMTDKQKKEEEFDFAREMEEFNHVEFDMSGFLTEYIVLCVSGHKQTGEELKAVKDLQTLCLNQLDRLVPLRRNALHNAEMILKTL